MYECLIEEPTQDNYYLLRLDFDKGTFQHRYKKTVYEGGDGVYETVHRGSFTKESSGAAKRSVTKKSSKKVLNSPPVSDPVMNSISSPRKPDPTTYYVARVEVRDYFSCWEPWDKRQAEENVHRVGDTFHQELLFRYVSPDEIMNDNVSPACAMRICKDKEN